MSLTPRTKDLLRLLTEIADAGDVCPRNPDLAEALGTHSLHSVTVWLRALEVAGLVLVERIGWDRIVTIAATGKATARPQVNRTRRIQQHTAKAMIDGSTTIVSRDPCFKCGVRGDIGCEHQSPIPPMALADRGRIAA